MGSLLKSFREPVAVASIGTALCGAPCRANDPPPFSELRVFYAMQRAEAILAGEAFLAGVITKEQLDADVAISFLRLDARVAGAWRARGKEPPAFHGFFVPPTRQEDGEMAAIDPLAESVTLFASVFEEPPDNPAASAEFVLFASDEFGVFTTFDLGIDTNPLDGYSLTFDPRTLPIADDSAIPVEVVFFDASGRLMSGDIGVATVPAPGAGTAGLLVFVCTAVRRRRR